jgi:hypothetical protein
MNILCVYVDLNEPEQQLEKVADYLSSFNAGTRAGERMWFVKTSKKPDQVRDEINKLSIPAGYHILIFEVGEKWVTHSAKDEVNSWMGKHI